MSDTKHTPGAIRPETAIETAANAAVRWRSQYADWREDNKFSDGTTKGEVSDALDRASHTPENIARILNEGWAYCRCDCCGQYWRVVAALKDPWSDSSIRLCARCIDAAKSVLDQFPDARAAIAKATGQDGAA